MNKTYCLAAISLSLILLVVFAIVFTPINAVIASPDGPGSISGRVTDEDGAPLVGIEVILNTHRAQVLDPTIFTNVGIPATERDLLAVKSTNHFYRGFAAISEDILYVECPGVYPSDYHATDYRKVRRPLWPLDDIGWDDVERNQSF